MTWRTLGVYQLGKDWVYTPVSSSSIYRVTSTLGSSVQGVVRGVIAQCLDLDNSLFDLRRLNYRPEKEIFLLLNPEGLITRKIALRRTDDLDAEWTVTIEELTSVAQINLPLEINAVLGLTAELTKLHELISARSEKIHSHVIDDVNQLVEVLNQKLNASVFDQQQPLIAQALTDINDLKFDKASIAHQHEMFEINYLDGIIVNLQEKVVEANAGVASLGIAVSGKASVNHSHLATSIIVFENYLALGNNLLLSDWMQLIDEQFQNTNGLVLNSINDIRTLENLVSNRALLTHSHQLSEINGLSSALDAKADNFHDSWQNINFLNGWVNYGSGFASAQFRKVTQNLVVVKGNIKNPSSSALPLVATLPEDYRPNENLTFSPAATGRTNRLFVRPNGNIELANYSNSDASIECLFAI